MMKKNVSKTVTEKLCIGCGSCQDICPKGCIIIIHDNINFPKVEYNSCIECGRCLKVCPGLGINIKGRAESLFSGSKIKENIYLGRYINCYKGYSTNYELRYHSASGGCLSQFLIWLLSRKIIDGVAVTRFMDNAPMKPEPFIARTEDDILSAKSSKYCVVSIDGIINKIKSNPGNYAVVGLPCHIHAYRKAMDIDRTLRDRIKICVAIYCSSNKTMDSQRYLLYRYRVDESKLKSFSYRDNGCLGSMHFRDKKGEDIVSPINYLDYYIGMRGFFNAPRCEQCNDFFGELADISFGDLNTGEKDDDPIGINSLIVRTEECKQWLEQCQQEGFLFLSEIDDDTMIEAQGYCKKKKKGPGFYAERNFNKLYGRSVPEYDNLLPIKPQLKDYIKVMVGRVMRFVGKHPVMWPIIKKLDNKTNN